MKKLEKDWITSGLIDFEYKKYLLLAYLQNVQQQFGKEKLYPFMADLVAHYQDAQSFKNRKTLLKSGFPKEITRIDLEKMKLAYAEQAQDSELMKHLEEIVEYAIPKMKGTLGVGKELYESIEKELLLEPIGIMPLYRDEGYLIMELGNGKRADIYEYRINQFVTSGEGFRGIYFKFMQSIRRGFGDTFESIKLGLIRAYQKLPNPATYLLQAPRPYPFKATIMPVAKRLMLRTVSVSDDGSYVDG